MSVWKKIPEGAEVIITGGVNEEVLFPLDTDPDFVVRGLITIDGKQIKADIGLIEAVCGWGECFHELNPRLYREVKGQKT